MLIRYNLTEDAFALPPERKIDIRRDYKKLYLDEDVIGQYKLEEKGESSIQVEQRNAFQVQFLSLIDSFKVWGEQNNCVNDRLLHNIETFKNSIFDPAYSGNQTAAYFSNIKQNLEDIWFTLQGDEKEISLHQKQEAFKQLCGSMYVCAPGIYTHVEDTLNALNAEVSLERWLADLRTSFIRQYADKHVRKYRISAGNSIHVYNAFLVYALNEGLAPMSHVSKIADPFIAAHTEIDAKEVEKFFKEFENFYSLKEISNCICTNFFYEFNQIRRSLNLDAKEGWTPATPEFLKKIEELANIIGIKEINFFDLSEDFQSMRFNQSLFKAGFLKACKENNKIFSPHLWRELSLGEYKLHSYGEDINSVWFQTPEKEILNWGKISEDIDPRVLLASFLAQAPVKDWNFIIERVSSALGKSFLNPKDLGHIAGSLPEKWMFDAFLRQFERPEKLATIFKNVDDINQFLIPLMATSAEKWKYDSFFHVLGPNLAGNAVFDGNIELIPFLSKKLRNFEGLKNERSKENFYHFAVRENRPESILALSETKLDVNAVNTNGWSPFHDAAYNSTPEVLSALVHAKADLNKITEKSIASPLSLALHNKNPLALKTILELKADVNKIFGKGYTVMIIAADSGKMEAIPLLVEFKADINHQTPLGSGVLHLAAIKNHVNTINTLVEFKADINAVNVKGATPAMIALINGSKESLFNLIELKADLNKPDLEGNTVAHHAILNLDKSLSFLKKLKAAGVDFTRLNNAGFSAVDLAVTLQNTPAIMAMLLNENPGPEWDHRNLAHLAAKTGSMELLKKVLETKIDINLEDKEGRTPLHIAAESGHANVLRSLAENKADLNKRAKKGMTLAHLAAINDKPEVISALTEFKMDLEEENLSHDTPLMSAVRSGNIAPVIELINSKANPSKLDRNELPLSFLAATEGHAELIRVLFLNGADVNEPWFGKDQKNVWFGSTLTHIAAKDNRPEMIAVLAECKANLEEKDKAGYTPLQIAVKMGNWQVVEQYAKYQISFDNIYSRDPEGKTPFAKAVEQHDWKIIAIMLMTMKNDLNLKTATKKFLTEHRDDLTNAFIEIAKKMNLEERNHAIGQLAKSENVLGALLNKPGSSILHFIRSGTRQGMTEKMHRIVTEFEYKPEAGVHDRKEEKKRI